MTKWQSKKQTVQRIPPPTSPSRFCETSTKYSLMASWITSESWSYCESLPLLPVKEAEKFGKRRPCIWAWLRHAFSDSAIALFGNLYVMALAGPQASSYAVCYFSSSLPRIAGQRFSTVGMPVFIGQSVVKFLSVGKQRFLQTGKYKRKGASVLLVLFPGRIRDPLSLFQTTLGLEDPYHVEPPSLSSFILWKIIIPLWKPSA